METTLATIFILQALILNVWNCSAVTTTRHVMDDDNDLFLLLPFPIDVCFTAKNNPITHTRYQCSPDGTQLYRKEWDASSAADCHTNTNGQITATFNASTSTPCHKGAFECSGDDNYVMHHVWRKKQPTETCDGSPVLTAPLPTALGCFCTDTTSIEVLCTDAYNGQFIQYSDASCATVTNTQSISNCSAIFTMELLGTTYNILSEIATCTINGTTIHKTPSPTAETLAPTTRAPTGETPSPITYGSRFIMDNDWLFGHSYPFPIDKCLQTHPRVTLKGISPEFVYYECNSALDQVTKYKWTGVGDTFDCNGTSTAQISVITADMHHNDICNPNYFNCHGNDDYVTTLFQGSTENECSTAAFVFTTSMVTDACFCDDTELQTSHQLRCSEAGAMVYDFEGTASCVNTTDPDPIVNVIGKNNECAFWKSVDIPTPTETYQIFGTMKECIKDNVDAFTLAPTSVPTMRTSAPSASPTMQTASPTPQPTRNPLLPGQTVAPSNAPTTPFPTVSPTTAAPTDSPTDFTQAPVKAPTGLTYPPTAGPTADPTDSPTATEGAFTSTDDGEDIKGRQNVDNSKKETETVIIVVMIVVVVLCCCIAVVILWLRMKHQEKRDEPNTKLPGELEAVKSKDVDEDESNERNEEETGDPVGVKEDEVAIEETEKVGLKTGRKRKRKPKRRRKRKKKEDSSDDDDDILDENEKKQVELVTAGGPNDTKTSDDGDTNSDATYDEEEKEAEFVTPGGADKDTSTDTDTEY